MSRGRCLSTLVLGAFSSALTILPWLHTLDHRDDHVHVDGAIVFLGHEDDDHDEANEHEHEHEHGHGHGHEHGDDDGSGGWDHPDHHAPHGRGALAHGSAFILVGAIFLFPPPALLRARLPQPPRPEPPALAAQHMPRLTRGPPPAVRS
jgi:hypothetical protein